MARPLLRFTAALLAPGLIVTSQGATSAAPAQKAVLARPSAQAAEPDGHGKINWPQLGFDAGHSGFNPYEHRITQTNVRNLHQLWTFNIDSWPGDIVLNNGILFIPSASGMLFAANATTAQPLWSYNSGVPYGWNTGTNTVAADGAYVFTICALTGGNQGICALSAQSGTVQWSYALPGTSSYPASPPAVADGLVFFEACSSAGCDHVALDETTGSPVWMVAESCAASYGIPPAVYQRILYVPEGCDVGGTNTIVAMSDQSGEVFWTRKVSGINHGMSVSDGIVAYVHWDGSNGLLGTLNATSGHPIWGPEELGYQPITSMPAIAYKQIYAWIFIYDYGWVADYSKRDGHQVWKYWIARSFPSIEDHIAWIAMNGSPLALNAGNGQFLWDVGGTDNLGLPIIANGIVYGGCNGSHVCAYSP